MDKYISVEEAKRFFNLNFGGVSHAVIAARLLDEIPATDVAPVHHGYWIGLEYDGYADGYPVYDLWECSECGQEEKGEDVPETHSYCHNCGAIMDGYTENG